jgi:hypothetical protein
MQSITIITNIVSSNTRLCDKVCQLHATGRWLSPGTQVSSTNKTDRNDITEILLKVALNTKHRMSVIFKSIRNYNIMYTIKFYSKKKLPRWCNGHCAFSTQPEALMSIKKYE